MGGASSRWQYACGLSPCSRTDADATVVQSVVEAARADDVDGVVYFTDGDGPVPEEPPQVPTLWILTKPRKFDCSFGQKAYLRLRS